MPLQEVVRLLSDGSRLATPGGRFELEKCEFHVLIQLHDGGVVATSIAIVWCREDRHDILIVTPVVPLHYKLVGPGDEFETVRMVKLGRYVGPECVSCSPRRNTPTGPIIRIRP